MMSLTQRLAARRLLLGLIIVSLLFALLHAGPLNGSRVALVLVVLGQLYLPGWLLARMLGKAAHPHPIVRFAWVLLCGLGLTILIAGFCLLLRIPIPVYIVLLHGVMLALALLKPTSPAPETPWRLTRRSAPLYLLVALACVITFGVGSAGRYRFWGFEDQTVFISIADWLANNPGQYPRGLPLRTRQAGVVTNDTRQDTDGWTASHAAWSWSSGVSASDIIWFDLNPLFIWAVPLVTFALAYEVTQRETAAAWSAAALVFAGLLTLDNLVYYPAYTAYGRFAVFQINSLRQMALTIMLPLAWMAALSYLRAGRRRDLPLVLLAGLALAMLHPIPVMLFQISIGAAALVRWLAQPSRARLRQFVPLVIVLGLLLALPLIQRLNRSGLQAADTLISETVLNAVETTTSVGNFLVLRDMPLVGTTYVRDPDDFFYHPVIIATIILGLMVVAVWRRSLAAQFIFPATLLVLLLSFTPGLTALYNGFVSSVGLLLTVFMLPIPLILGVSLDSVLRWMEKQAAPARRYGQPLAAVLAVAVLLILIFEPFPIPASARDQLEAYNLMQVERQVQPFHDALVASLRRVLPADKTSVLALPYNATSVVLDEVSNTLVTGGRASRNQARKGDDRFFGRSDPPAPWLDSADIAFLKDYGVAHIVVEASSTRLPQLLMQPERFTLLNTPAGYAVFAVAPDIVPDAVDNLFERMNTLYGENPPPVRDGGFALSFPADKTLWSPLVEEWQAVVNGAPDDDRARLGLAFSAMLAGDYSPAASLWQELRRRYSDVPLITDGLAYTLSALGDTQAAQPLLDALVSNSAAARVLAARTLLTRDFIYLLNRDQLQQVIAVTESDFPVWWHLAVFDQPDAQRRRAALLMYAGQWAAAQKGLSDLPPVRLSAQDILAQAGLALVQGDVSRAIETLRPAIDEGWLKPRIRLHPDRWQNNVAAQAYFLLAGDLAAREGRLNDAQTAYQQAIDWGSAVTGRVFLAQSLEHSGQTERAARLLAEAESSWQSVHESPLPQLESLLTMADTRSLYAMLPAVEHGADERHLTVSATFGNLLPREMFPVQSWHIEIIHPDDATEYASTDFPAAFADAALARVLVDIELPDDIPPLLPALAYVQPRYDQAITADAVTAPVTLNRPDSATIPPDAVAVSRRFGDAITLHSYRLEATSDHLTVTLYWQADQPLPEDYQVFVHIVGPDGSIVKQGDSAPLDNRYPTSQWRTGVTIADPHTLTFDTPLPSGEYVVRIGLYRMGDFTRLPVTPLDERIQNDSLLLATFTR